MLARAHRLVSADDYRLTVRKGRRTTAADVAVYVRVTSSGAAPRFGFIVAKTVGNAVVRNTVRRRLKSIALAALPGVESGTDVVIRALPGAAQATWATLNSEITETFSKGRARE